MSKAILILDKMPVDCDDCTLAYNASGLGVRCSITNKYVGEGWADCANGIRDGLCPLRSFPKRRKSIDEFTYRAGIADGWNELLDVMEGPEDD